MSAAARFEFDLAHNIATVTVDCTVAPTRTVDLGRALVHLDDGGAVARIDVADAQLDKPGELWWWLTEVIRRSRWDGSRPEPVVG